MATTGRRILWAEEQGVIAGEPLKKATRSAK